MESDNELVVEVLDGKYTVIQDSKGGIKALRYGEEWRDCCGDGLILALAQEIYELRQQKTANAVAEAVAKLPFGKSAALPWCRESFPELNDAMEKYEKTCHRSVVTYGDWAMRILSKTCTAIK